MSEKTRKAVTTLSQVNDAWEGFRAALDGLNVNTSEWRLVQPVSGGFEILGTNLPESVPLNYATKDAAYNTFITWGAVITLVKAMGQDEATVNPDTGETPKPVTPKRRKVETAA
jgi:hypothetical protein